MSIYPVRLNEWFPFGDENYIGYIPWSCHACYSKVNYKKAVGHHSFPFGHGEIWCNWKCQKSGKTGSMDKRQKRTFNRKHERIRKFLKSSIDKKQK